MRYDNSKPMVFEGLEERRLMAIPVPGPTPPPPKWPIVVNGTAGDDVIKVSQSGLYFVVTQNGSTTYNPVEQVSTISIFGNDGSDLIDCSGVSRKVYVEGGNQSDTIIGGSGNDTIYGSAPYTGQYSWADYCLDSIDGNSGNDLLFASHWASGTTLNGGPGDDAINGSEGSDVITGGTGNDQILASNGNNVVDAGADNDIVDAGWGTDAVYGGIGNDSISTGVGADTIWGGAAADQRFMTPDGGDQINAGEGANNVHGDAGDDVISTGEGLNKVYGDAGNDIISTGSGNDSVWGGLGNDQIWTGLGYDSLFGEAGDDSLDGGANNDWMDGGVGNDSINPGAGPNGNDSDTDIMFGGDGTDTVSYAGRFSTLDIHVDGSWSSGAVTYDAYGTKQYPEHEYIGTDVENAIGNNYNNLITGNALSNALSGEGGNDTIYGGIGDDTLSGSYGDDVLYGQDGADSITGDDGKDRLYGGHDNDTLDGGFHDDLLISLGGGSDSVIGGPFIPGEQGDMFWVGPEDTTVTDPWVAGQGNVHVISSFANGASTALDGQDLVDPAIGSIDCANCNPFYSSASQFANVPLFQPAGPNRDDVDQNKLGDCYFMAPLAGIAGAHSDVIRRSVTDLGDGTYAVRFFSGGVEKFYRVDAQLPVETVNNQNVLCFAGAANNTLWGPIMEKAFCFFRSGAHSYAGIESGSSGSTFDAFNISSDTDEVIWHTKNSYMTAMRDCLAAGGVVTAQTDPAALGCDLASSHVYTVVGISADLKTVMLRNPWHTDDKDFESGDNDGYISISVDQFDDDFYYITYATF
jgi:Ca2+-binding RTX toxin-like protein